MLLVAIVTGAKADETIYSWESPEGTEIQSGGTATYEHGDGSGRVNYANSTYYTLCLSGKKGNIDDTDASAAAGYINIALDEALAENDQIKITAYLNKSESKKASAWIVYSNGQTVDSGDYGDAANIGFGTPAGTPQTKTITVTEAAAGSTSFKMTRGTAGTNLFIIKLEIIRSGAATKVATPTCTLGAWDAVNGKYAVTLNCTTAGHTIKYSTDNKVSYSDYSTALALAPGTTLDAYAVKEGMDNSDNMVQYTVPAAPVAVTGVTLNKNATTLTVGGNETLTATVTPDNAADKSVSWSSSDGSVASVNSSGKITAVAAGEATITVTTTDGGYEATCTVTVEAAPSGITPVANQTWDINSMFSGNVSSTTIKDNMEVITNQSLTVGSSSKTFPDKSTFNKYIALKNGSSTPLHIQVVPNSIITVYVAGGSGKNVKVSKGSATAEAMMEVATTSAGINPSCIYTGSTNADIYISNSGGSNGLNVYAVKVEPATTITLNASGFATYSSATDFEFTGADAYGLTLTTEALTSTKVTSGKVAAGEGVLFKGEAGATVAIMETTGATEISGNSLLGTTAANGSTVSPDYASNKYYALKGGTFKYYTGATFAANKAVFCVDKSTNLPNEFAISFDDATAIKGIAETEADAAAPVKVIKNGQLYIGNYNVAGQQVK